MSVNVRDCKAFFEDTANLGYRYDKEADVALYDFDTFSLKAMLTDAATFLGSFRRIAKIADVPDDGGLAPELLNRIRARFPKLAFPVQAEFRPQDIHGGQYYVCALADSSDQSNHVKLGGFGALGGPHASHEIAAALCISLDSLLKAWPYLLTGRSQVIYGKPDVESGEITDPKPVTLTRLNILFPKTIDDLKKLVGIR